MQQVISVGIRILNQSERKEQAKVIPDIKVIMENLLYESR